MDSYPANSFFNNFTNLFNRIEKTEGTPVISSFSFLSGKNTEPQNISTQKPHPITYENGSPVEKDLDGIDVFSQINSRTPSETKVFTEAEVVLAKTNQHNDKCNSHNNLDQRSSQGQVMNDVETNINASMDKDDIEIQVSPTHTGKKFLDMDPQVSMDQGNLWKDSSLTCQNDQRVADSHLMSKADLQSKAFSQEYNKTSMSNTASADNHRIGDLSKCIRKQTATNITYEKTLSTPQYEGKCQEWTNEVKLIRTKTQEPSDVNENEELYTESTSETSSTDINNPVSTIAVSDQAGKTMSTFKSNLDIPNGGFGTNTACADTGNNKIQPKEEFWIFSSPDTCNGCHVESDKQFSSETGDAFSKANSDRVLLNLEPTTPDIFNKTQKGARTNNIQELSKLEIKKNGGQDKQIAMKVKSNDEVQIEGENIETEIKEEKNDILQKDSISEVVCISSAPGKLEEPLHIKNASRSSRRVTFSPGLKLENPPQLPSIFSGLKGLKKEVHDQQKIASGLEQPKSPVLKPASVKRALFSEKHYKVEVKGSILEQLSQLLSFDAGKTGAKKPQEPTASPPLSPISKAPESEMLPVEEIVEGPDVASSEESNKLTNTETALNAFKAFFSPKPAKRDTSDLDAVKRAFNPETIRAIFDRNSSKSPDNRNIFTTKVCTKKLLVKARFYLEMITFSRYLKFLIRTFSD